MEQKVGSHHTQQEVPSPSHDKVPLNVKPHVSSHVEEEVPLLVTDKVPSHVEADIPSPLQKKIHSHEAQKGSEGISTYDQDVSPLDEGGSPRKKLKKEKYLKKEKMPDCDRGKEDRHKYKGALKKIWRWFERTSQGSF